MIPRRFLETVIAQMPSAVAVLEAPSGKPIIANERAAEIWRRHPIIERAREGAAGDDDEYVGYTMDGRRVTYEQWPVVRSLRTGEVVRGEEFEIARGDGTRGFIRVHSAPVYDDDGTMIAAVVTFDDVTEHRTLLAQAQHSEAELSTVANALPLLVSFVDRSLTFRFVNQAYVEWVGRRREDILGKTMQELLDQATLTSVLPDVQRALAGEEVVTEVSVPHRSGAARLVRTRFLPRRDAAGAVEGFVVVAEDVTGHRKAEDGIRLISEASRMLASSLDVRVTLGNLAGLVVPRIGDWCSIELLNEAGSPEQLAVAHVDPKKVALARAMRERYPPGRTGGIADVLRFGKSQLVSEIPEGALELVAQDAEHLALLRTLEMHSAILVPLRARDRVLGVMMLLTGESGRRFGEDDLALVEELAARASLAVDNARLFEAERASRRELEVANQRLRVLSDASRGFAKHSRDIEALLGFLTTTLVDALGDLAGINIVAADGVTLELVSLASRFPELEDELRRLTTASPMRVGNGVLGGVVARGDPLLIPNIDRAAMRTTVNPAYRALFDRTKTQSLMVVPLRARDRVTGCVTVARASGRPYDEHDLELLVELADRAGLALENADLYARARNAVQLRDEFLSVASHELKTPLTTLTLQISSVLRAAGPNASATVSVEHLKKLDRQLDRMTDLVTRLLDVSRIAGGRLQLEVDDADLGELAREVAARFTEQMERAGSTLALDVRGDVHARCDAGRIDQVITNLVTNALKFGAGKPVHVTVDGTGADIVLSVRDHGHGVAPEDQARIFERFERASPARNYGGLGLGLWIARQIMDAHGGSLSVTSGIQQGATFTAVLHRDPVIARPAVSSPPGFIAVPRTPAGDR